MKLMNCISARERLPAYIEGDLRGLESAAIQRHLLGCSACHQDYEYQARLSSPLRELPDVTPPPILATAIRLRLPSQGRPRFWERWEVHLSNFMRPFALPASGGLLTALILFGALMPAVALTRVTSAVNSGKDVPTMLVTEPRFKGASPFPLTEDLVVEAWIDDRGNITDFEVLNPSERGAAADKMMLIQSGNVLLTTRFEPATRFGQPTAGKVLLAFHRINIRG